MRIPRVKTPTVLHAFRRLRNGRGNQAPKGKALLYVNRRRKLEGTVIPPGGPKPLVHYDTYHALIDARELPAFPCLFAYHTDEDYAVRCTELSTRWEELDRSSWEMLYWEQHFKENLLNIRLPEAFEYWPTISPTNFPCSFWWAVATFGFNPPVLIEAAKESEADNDDLFQFLSRFLKESIWLRPCESPACKSRLAISHLLCKLLARVLRKEDPQLEEYLNKKRSAEQPAAAVDDPAPSHPQRTAFSVLQLAPTRNRTPVSVAAVFNGVKNATSSGFSSAKALEKFGPQYAGLDQHSQEHFLGFLPHLIRDAFLEPDPDCSWAKDRFPLYTDWRKGVCSTTGTGQLTLRCPYPLNDHMKACPRLYAQDRNNISNLSLHIASRHLVLAQKRMLQLEACLRDGCEVPDIEAYAAMNKPKSYLFEPGNRKH